MRLNLRRAIIGIIAVAAAAIFLFVVVQALADRGSAVGEVIATDFSIAADMSYLVCEYFQ